MTDFDNPYETPREKSPGEVEGERGSILLTFFRWLKVDMPEETDEAAVERTGVLLTRWMRRRGLWCWK